MSRKVRLHLSYVNETTEIAIFLELHANVLTTQCSTLRYPFRRARYQTLQRSPRNICSYRLQPLCQLLDAGARLHAAERLLDNFRQALHRIQVGRAPRCKSHPRRRFALCQSRSNHPNGLGMENWRDSFNRPNLATSMFPDDPRSGMDRPRDLM